MSGANAFIATTKQFASLAKIFCTPDRSYPRSVWQQLELFAHSQGMGEVLPTSNRNDFGPIIIGMVDEVGSDRLHEVRERFMIVSRIVRQ